MKRIGPCISLIMAVCLLQLPTLALSDQHYTVAQQIDEAFINKKPRPLASQMINGLTAAQAQKIQDVLVRKMIDRGEIPMGYKAGLWASGAQKRFGYDAPVAGTIFKSMLRWPGIVYLKNHARLFIESEIGFRLKEEITIPVDNLLDLKKAVAIVFPAIELPDVAYSNMKLLKGVDLIATNVAARKVLIGNATRVEDLNAVTVRLIHNGQQIASGTGNMAGGDQWEALKWLVNDVLARGGEIKAGDVFITGSLTGLIPAKPGKYVADYGSFGMIEFEFK